MTNIKMIKWRERNRRGYHTRNTYGDKLMRNKRPGASLGRRKRWRYHIRYVTWRSVVDIIRTNAQKRGANVQAANNKKSMLFFFVLTNQSKESESMFVCLCCSILLPFQHLCTPYLYYSNMIYMFHPPLRTKTVISILI